MKDWRGTEIEVGSKILFAGGRDSYKSFALGTVTKLEERRWGGSVWADWHAHSDSDNKKSRELQAANVTVLTEDMFPDLVERVATLEGDIEYYKSEIARTW